MRRVSTADLRTGDRLGRDIYVDGDGLLLLRAGVRVSDSYQSALRRAGISSVWIDDGLSEGIEPIEIVRETTRRRAMTTIREAFREVSGSATGRAALSHHTVREMADVAELIADDVAGNVHSALALNDLANADGYTLKHSLSVTTLGLSLGLRVMRTYGWVDARGKVRYDGIAERLTVLGVGLLLHDIGKLAVPPSILRKAGPLTGEEWTAMREHPMLGVHILKQAAGISPLVRAVVRSHHERWDGTGYPNGTAGADIHQFARIAAAADVFDALTSDRCYRNGMPPHEAYDFVVNGAGSDFDPEVVDIFRTFVAPYPPGTYVVLSDGSRALVKQVHPGAVRRPVVRVFADAAGRPMTPEEIDLGRRDDVGIASAAAEVPALEPV
jgi:HD-GYP domain-containing protein (c-di-GMP phosphodiesterase class II)